MGQSFAARLETRERSDRTEPGAGSAGRSLPAAVAHELANPLVAMTQAISVLRESLTRVEDQALAGHVLAEGRRLRRLVQRAAIAGWRPVRATDPASIETVIHGVLALVRFDPSVPADVRFHLRLAPGLRPVVMDPDAIAQVLWNLLLNAAQAVREGGNVTLAAEWADASRLAVEICDDGPGLPDLPIERLLAPCVSARAGGSGLGLSVSREIVEAHGGSLTLGPAQGGGARVRFCLPKDGPQG